MEQPESEEMLMNFKSKEAGCSNIKKIKLDIGIVSYEARACKQRDLALARPCIAFPHFLPPL